MSRRSGNLRPDFSRTDAYKTKRSAANSQRFKRRLNHETLEKRELLAADLLAIRPDAGELLREQSVLNSPPREFSLLFNGDASIDESTISSDSIRLVRAGGDGVFGDANDVQVSIGYVGFVDPGGTDPENLNRIMLRPASTAAHNATDPSVAFPDDLYRIEIIGSGADPLMDSDGSAFNGGLDSLTTFRLDRGLQVIAVIPQPIERVGGVLEVQDKRIDVYFDDQEIDESVAETKEFYRLVDTAGAPTAAVNPDTVDYFPDENRVQLNFAAAFSTATYRLDIGLQSALPGSAVPTDQPFAGEIGTWFGDLLNVGDAGNFGDIGSGTAVKFSSEISPAGAVALPARPGGTDEPGHREIQLENHYTLPNTGVDPVTPEDIKVIRYAFPANFRPNDAGIVYQNFISPSEKEIVRGILEIYAAEVGVEFIETELVDDTTLVIGKGDLQASTTSDTSEPGGVAGRGGPTLVVLDKEDYADSNRTFGDGFTDVMFHEIGHALGLGHSYELHSVQGEGVQSDSGGSVTSPGDADLIHLQRISPANANDIDLYRFNITSPGTVQIETIAERLTQAEHGKDPSLLNTVLRLFRKNADGTSEVIAQNDRYYGSDSFIEMELEAGEYFFGVSSTGNDQYDPAIADSGFGGTTDGEYEVQLSFNAIPVAGEQLTDIDGTAIDGDGDGTPGGVHSFWFDNADAANTFYVDKLGADVDIDGTIVASHTTIAAALLAAQASAGRSIVRVVGSLDDNTAASLSATTPYLIGFEPDGTPLADGTSLNVPQDTTVRIESGALLKMRAANIDVGTSSIGADRSGGAIQVLGTPDLPVYLRSYHDDTVGGNSDGIGPGARAGDYGGIVMRDDSDMEDSGVFLNIVNHLDIRHGGGKGNPTDTQVYSPIDIVDSRPTVSFNTITDAARAAVAATPDSFNDAGGRIGPDIVGNYLDGNTNNGLFVGIPTALGGSVQTMTVSGRFDDTDITHILTESLIIEGNPGGPTLVGGTVVDFGDPIGEVLIGGTLEARPSGRLVIDPGTVVKLSEARIEAARGAATLIAEGTQNSPIIFTSLDDSRYGGSGVFDTNTGVGSAAPGDWGGLFFSEASSGSIDQAVIAYGGGVVPTGASAGGAADSFNAIEIHQADVRVANSLITDNASGNASTDRFGRGTNEAAAIFVRGAQPILIGNEIVNNAGPAININANALTYESLVDSGRSIGAADRYSQFDDNRGPLVRLNETDNNTINGMKVRGQELTTESVWDDSDIVHVLSGEVIVENHHTYSGLRLQSSVSESLVVKVDGSDSGFTATGDPLDIVDRIGGTIQVIGLPGYPVVITHLADDTVGAGFTPEGRVNFDTDNDDSGVAGGDEWRGFLFDEWSNDRNVAIILEAESPLSGTVEVNSNPITKAQPLGILAPDMKSGDENRRLGFEVHGYISPNNSKDVDAYSFQATAGTQVWIDIDRTDPSLDLVMELVLDDGTASGQVVATLDDPIAAGDLGSLTQEPLLGGDFFTLTNNDPGVSAILNASGQYFVRVKSAGAQVTNGAYQLQVRLQQVDEFPGSTVRYADIRYASTAFDVRGLPRHSPLIGEAAEQGDAGANVTPGGSQELANLLASDTATLSIAGSLGSETDVDVYRFEVSHPSTQVIPGVTEDVGTVSVVFDLDYADERRGDTTIAVFNANNELIFVGRESNIEDDQPEVGGDGQSLDDLSRGSLGTDDPSIGPVHLTPGGSYYVAVMSNQFTPSVVASQFSIQGENGTGNAGILTRLEPINSVTRVVEDHIGFTGYTSGIDDLISQINPTSVEPLIDISTKAALDQHITPFRLQDVALFVATDSNGDNGDNFYTVDPSNGGGIVNDLTPDSANLTSGGDDVQDIVIRGDGRMYGYHEIEDGADTVGVLSQLNPANGQVIVGTSQNDNIPGVEGYSNVSAIPDPEDTNNNTANRTERARQVTNSDTADAVTFRRRSTTGASSAPVPVYETYYAVSEGVGGSSRLYRGDADGNALPAPALNDGTPQYGLVGNIQPSGVDYAETDFRVESGGDNSVVTGIYIRATVPGEAGNFSLTFSLGSSGEPTEATFNAITNTMDVRLSQAGSPLAVTATAQDIVDAINESDETRDRAIALIFDNGGNLDGAGGTVANFRPGIVDVDGGVGTAEEVLQGTVTGLSMGGFGGGGQLYGVTSAGEFLEINRNTGVAEVLSTTVGISFTGLALGPQNVEGGIYSNVLFATASNGELYAFDTDGNAVRAFNSGDASQTITVTPGVPSANGTFTLTFDDGTTTATTAPISANAPAVDSVNELQTITSTATSGTFTLSYDDGTTTETTGPLQFDADNIDVLSALAALPNLSAGDIQVTATDPANPTVINGLTIEFRGGLAQTDIAALVVNDIDLDPAGSVSVSTEVTGAQSVRDALIALPNITTNSIRVSGDLQDGGAVVHFTGLLFNGIDVNPLIVDDTGLLDGTLADVAVTGTVGDDLADDIRISVSGMNGTPIGLAFSPLDFNLWHPTMQRGNDAGHGINAASDGSRDSGNFTVEIEDGLRPTSLDEFGNIVPGTRTTNEGAGGASFYFGFEQWQLSPQSTTLSYITPTDVTTNAQYGLNQLQHQDLSSNTALRDTYDFAGGAKGGLTTNSFSLDGSVAEDRPTLYFNYFLETEADDGKQVSDTEAERFFRDSARVYASRDGGLTWELLATNNSALSDPDASDANGQAELPTFLSHVSDAGVNSSDPQPAEKQIRQELIDNDGAEVWRQARVDLSTFAGETDVQLRFEFSTSGSSIQGDLVGDEFGDINESDSENSVGGLNNNFEGLYLDDFIVGFAERGEMVTAAPGTATNAFVDLSSLTDQIDGGASDADRADVNRDDNALTNQLSGRYQLEIRRAGEFALASGDATVLVAHYDTNARHILDSLLGTGLDADQNRERAQGILILESNILSDSRVLGINVEPGEVEGDADPDDNPDAADAGVGVSYPGSTQNFADVDDARLVPGIVIQNNIIVGSSGINYSGEANTDPQRPVPIGRIINNTFVGDGGGVGVNVNNNASPTLLNNVFAELATGIVNNGVGAVIDNNFFQNAGAPIGSDARTDNNPLFVDADNGNYYPAVGAGTINNSQDVLNDRGSYAAFKDILGIPDSPFFAPTLDAFGQLRVSGGVGGDGAGPNTDIDIGALDFSDSTQPYAVLLDPVDNDIDGVDLDPNDTFVHWDETIVGAFSILLSDGENPDSPFEGTGVNPDTVDETTVSIRRNNEVLTAEQDFLLAFNSSTGELRLTPLSTLWTLDSVYEITLDNTQIEDLAGNPLRSNRTDGTTAFTIVLPDTQIDFGDASDGTLADPYGSLLINDGARHAMVDDIRLGAEFDGESDAPLPGGSDDATGLADEDGVGVGIYNDGTTDRRVFLNAGSQATTLDKTEVLGFLNPLNPNGADFVLTASADGLLDAWVDFNGNQVFDSNEQIFTSFPVVAGQNTLTIVTPDTAVAGTTWARFRISPEGGLSPTGLAVGGEVEDYQIDILPVALPVPNDDNDTTALYSVVEDGSLDTAGASLGSVIDNDTIDPNSFTPITASVVDGPSNAASFVFDKTTGHFTYTPVADFAGYDTFTYRLADQQSSIDGAPAYPTGVNDIATVTINVTPVNDQPEIDGDEQILYAVEEVTRVFSKNDILQGSDGVLDVVGDADPMYPSGTASAPWDESAQEDVDEIEIVSIEITPGTPITTSGTYPTARGSVTVVFSGGFLQSLEYTGNTDLNADNDVLGGTAPYLDSFLFTFQDNGKVINPLDLSDASDDVELTGTPLTNTATALIDVRPTNDAPVAADDTISENNADWIAYFSGLTPAVVAPVPTEDVTLTIPEGYLLRNDQESRAGANDELDNTNDAGLTVSDLDATSALGATLTFDVDGNVVYDPSTSANKYGIDTFVYTITDQGINQALDGTETAAPLSHQATVTVLLKPVNDAPLAIDRDFELTEFEEFANTTGDANADPDVADDRNGILTITAAMLLRDGQTDSALEASFSQRTDTLTGEGLFNEHETSLRVFGIGLPGNATPSFDAATLDYSLGDVTETLDTANGTLLLTFSNASGTGELTQVIYRPNTDFNDEVPFVSPDEFTYFVEDFGEVTVHGAASVGESATTTTHGTQRSGPATVSLTTRAVNDAPEFPVFNTVTFAEDVNADGAPVYYDIYGGSVIASDDPGVHGLDEMIFVSRDTALDERGDGAGHAATQDLTFTYSVDAPQGMFSAAPVLDEYGVLTLMPNPDVFGWAVIEVTATDNGQSYVSGSMQDDFRSVTRTVTVNITPVNDAPVTFDRSLEVLEVEEYANGTGDATNVVARLPFLPADFLGDATAPTGLAEQSDFTDDVDYDSSPGGVEYDEEEQGLRVVEFTVVDASGNPVVVDKDRNNGTPIALKTGVIAFEFDSEGAFTTGEYLPNVDYNEQAPFDPTEVFSYIVEDFGATRIPGSEIPDPDAVGSIDYTNTNNRSAPKQMTITTRAFNDAPEFPVFNTVTFAEDVNADGAPVYYDIYGGGVIASNDPGVHGLDEMIFVSRDTALDERGDGAGHAATQDLTFTYSVDAPQGMFSAAPVLDEYGVLTLMPNPDVFGWAVIEVTATDNGQSYISGSMQDDFRSVTRTVTVNITPVNDAPVTFDRSLEVLEVEEYANGTGDATNAVASLPLSPSDFLGDASIPTELAEQSDFTDDVDYDSSPGGVEYDEEEQGLRVVEFTVVDEFGNSVVVDKDNNNGTPITLSTGVITFEFDSEGAFTTGEYLPNVDYNEQAPFDPTEVFSYIVEDFGATRIPGSEIPDPDAVGSIDYTNTNNRSAPKQMTLTTRAVNDAPEFPVFNTVTFAEDVNADGAPVYYDLYGGSVIASDDPGVHGLDEMIFVSRDTALDERGDGAGHAATQDLTFTYSVDAPQGMFSAAPVLDEYGVLTLMPNPDVFGWAVIEVTATDNGQSYISGSMQDDFRSVTRTVTVNITPVNDAPVTFDRSLEVLEVEEYANGTGDATNAVASLPLSPSDFLGDASIPTELAEQSDFTDDVDYDSSPGGVEYDEEEQRLRVVEFTVVDEFGNPVVVDKDRNNGTPITLSTGVITFEFDASGAFTTGEYLPNVDYNEQAPFDPTEVFSYIVEDFGATRIPGSEIPAPDAVGSIDYTNTNNRSAAKQMTLTTRAVNDAPEFPVFNTVTFAEDINADGAPVYYDLYDGVVVASGDLAAHRVDEEIFVSRDTALDERVDGVQNLTFTYSVDAPQGMFSAAPVLDEYGVLTLMPNPDVFGWAVIEVTATDNGQSYISGLMQDDFRSVTRTVTVNITPVNDAPVTFDRSLEVLEVEEYANGTGDATNAVASLPLSPSDFLGDASIPTELAEQSDFTDDMDYDSSPGGVEYDEEEQGLRVVEFTVVDASGNPVVVDKDNHNGVPITLSTGVITFEFDASGAFTTGEYLPNVDYNEQAPFDPTEVFSYIVEDFGATRIPGSEIPDPDATGSIDYTNTNNRSAPKQMTLTTRAVNDAPRFDFNEGVFVLERDDLGQQNITDWATNILPSDSTALDELATQGVRFELQAALSSIPVGLFAVPPTVTEDGTMHLTTSVDAVGTAELVFNVVDYSLSNDPGFVSKFVQVTTTVHVQPVNDAPRLDPSVVPTPVDTNASVDDRYHIESDGTLVITMTEDNQINGGGTYRIYLEREDASERPGLLDLFTAGPLDEINGGQTVVGLPTTTLDAQTLALTGFPSTTTQGGTLVRGTEPGVDGREYLDYTPRLDQNFDTVGSDGFLYTVQDDGQTYNLGLTSFELGILRSDPMTSTGRVRILLNPVNDAPLFEVDPARVSGGDVVVTVTEGAPAGVTFNLIADRAAGPVGATDENDPVNGQSLSYVITPDPAVAYPGAFTTPPAVDSLGRLTFAAGADISGDFVFNIMAVDSGANDPTGRGDINTSALVPFTISITPVNDPPEVKQGEDGVVSETIAEEGSTTITEAELLAEFQGGPTAPAGSGAIDESTQGLIIFSGLPTDGGPAVTTTGGGTITRTGSTFNYTPAMNFAGQDAVIYQISDTATPDSPNISGTWLINVTPVNDAPDLGSLDLMLGLPEDVGSVRIEDWFADVTVGPAGNSSGNGRASDEIDGLGSIPAQSFASITIRPVATDDRYEDLFDFTAGDLDSVVRLDGDDLVFDVTPGASGAATFEVIVTDDGDDNAPNVATASAMLTITIDSSNDPPSFDIVGDNPIDVTEGDPLYVDNWADNVSAGDTGQSARFIVNVPAEDEDLFEVLPSIDATGELTFQFKEEANGSTVIGVSLTDDADPDDGQLLTSDGLPALTTAEVQLTISITPVNDAPVANDNDFITTEDNVLTFTINDLLGNDTDIDVGDELTLVQTGTLSTTLGALITINPTTETITYNPLDTSAIQELRPGTTIVDSFQYQVSDIAGELSNFATVRLTISGTNDAPTVVDDVIGFDYEENASGAPIAKPLTLAGNSIFENDFDIDINDTIDPLTFTVTIQPLYGELRQDAVTGEVTYLPGAEFLTVGGGKDSFEYTLSDIGGPISGQPSPPATVQIVTVPTPTMDPIRTGTFNNGTTQGTAVVDLDDLFASADPLDLTKTVIKVNGQNGLAEIDANGRLVYTPDPGHTGEDTVTIEVEDINGVKSGDVIIEFNTTVNERTNPAEPTDVNRNGFVTALDALMIINLLNEGTGATSGGIPIGTIPAEDDNYYDVNDDGFVTAVDALQVINMLNSQDNSPSSEPIAMAPSSPDAASGDASESASVSTVSTGTAKVVGGADAESEPDLLELIAIDNAAESSGSDSDDDSLTSNLDAAIADLF